MRNLQRYNDFYTLFDQASYYENYDAILKALLDHPSTKITIAALKEEPDIILGYSVSSFKKETDEAMKEATGITVVHFVYVRGRWRRLGLMKDLLPKSFEVITHLTNTGEKIWKQHYPTVKFNPFMI